jgi:hypothetical protein
MTLSVFNGGAWNAPYSMLKYKLEIYSLIPDAEDSSVVKKKQKDYLFFDSSITGVVRNAL